MTDGTNKRVKEYSKDQMLSWDLDEIKEYIKNLGLHISEEASTNKEVLVEEVLNYYDWKNARDSGNIPDQVNEFKDINISASPEEYDLFLNPLRIVDFVDYFSDYSIGITGTSSLFRVSVALWLISTMAGFKWRVSDVGYQTIFLYLNIWIMLIGKSRISHKSSIIKPAVLLVDQITEKRKIENKRLKQTYWLGAMLEHSFTPEALVTALNERCWERRTKFADWGMRTHAAWINTEFSKFFSKLEKSDYMSSISELLSLLYDGDTYTTRTQSRGREEVINPYLTILAGSTEALPMMFTKFQLTQGFLQRFIDVFYDKNVIPRQYRDRMEERYRKMREWLETLYNVNKDCFLILYDIEANNTDMTDELKKYEEFVDNEIENKELGLYESYLGNSPNLLRQLAGLFRISRMSLKELQDINNGIKDKHGRINWKFICMKDYLRAKEFLDAALENFQEIIRIVQEKVDDKPISTLNRHAFIIFSAIKKAYKDNGDKPVSLTQINRKMRNVLRSTDVRQVIEFLLEAGYVSQDTKQGLLGGPKTIYKPLKDSLDFN